MDNSIRIVIGGDIIPTNSGLNADVRKRNVIDKSVLEIIEKANIRIFNLECVITESDEKCIKAGPHLKCNYKDKEWIKVLNPHVLVGANNHALDYGRKGLLDTQEILDRIGIQYIGVGQNREEARRNAQKILNVNGMRIGLYCCAEDEFSSARSDGRAGANWFDPIVSFKDVKKLSNECDYLIVLYHGGLEYYRYPSPNLRKIFKEFADFGADLVIAQHGHCVACEEKYNSSRLIYGQGNFVYDNCIYDQKGEFTDALLIEIVLTQKELQDIIFHPLCVKKKTELLNGIDAQKVLEGFDKRSEYITHNGNVENAFQWEARSKYGMIKDWVTKNDFLRIHNCMQCDTLRELAICAFDISIGIYDRPFVSIIPNYEMKYLLSNKKISCFGAGKGFERFQSWAKNNNVLIEHVYVSDATIGHISLNNQDYKSETVRECTDKSEIILICTDTKHEREIYNTLVRLGYENIFAIGDIWELEIAEVQ